MYSQTAHIVASFSNKIEKAQEQVDNIHPVAPIRFKYDHGDARLIIVSAIRPVRLLSNVGTIFKQV